MPLNFENVRALIVDDNLFSRQLLRGVLQGLGLRHIRDVETGADALDAIKNMPPDIVFLDNIMDPMGGCEVTRKIRAAESDAIRFLPIVMVSGEATKDAIIEARDAGITEFLAKPITPLAVYTRLEMTVETPRNFVQVGGYFGPDRRRKIEDLAGDERRRVDADPIDPDRSPPPLATEEEA